MNGNGERLDPYSVNDFETFPAELRVAGGAFSFCELSGPELDVHS